MRNQYPGICYRCGKTVSPGAGHFEITTADQHAKWPGQRLPKWLMQHSDCARFYRGTAVHYQFNPAPKEAAR